MFKKCLEIRICFFVLVVGLAGIGQAKLPDPVGRWKLDDGAGTTAVDSSGNGYDATLGGDAAWVEGVFGGGVHFGGSGWIDLPVEVWNERIVPNATYSFCFWYNLPDAGANKVGFGSTLVGGGRHFQSHLPWSNGRIFYDTSGHRGNDQFWQAEWTGEWAFWTFQHDAVNGWKRYYRNDELIHDSTGQAATLPEATALVVGANGVHATGSIATYDDIRFYDLSLTVEDIQGIMAGIDLVEGQAVDPVPEDGATDVVRDAILAWSPGTYAVTHDVYFGENFDDVNNADTNSPFLLSPAQDANTYDPGRLQLGQNYFWRIDEVNAPPDSTVFPGEVWSFIVEPVGYPVSADRITLTASGQGNANEGPEKAIDGSGLDEDGKHSQEISEMWRSADSEPGQAWIQMDIDQVEKLSGIRVWNHNTALESVVGYGIKEALIEYSPDGIAWSEFGVLELAQATGTTDYQGVEIPLEGIVAKSVRITANSNWSSLGLKQYGLSEVRLLSVPVVAREPYPVSGATDVDVDVVLGWRAGRETASHDVYISTDPNALVLADSVNVPSFDTTSQDLSLGQIYHWRIDEVNDVETPTTWQGDVWNLSTQEYLVVDDFESYNDIPAGEEGSKLVYLTWLDGVDNPSANGSTMGYFTGESMEKSVVFDGTQSCPFSYDNTTAPYSEVTVNVASLQAGQDWTKHGVKGLTLRFSGDPGNVAQQMYVKINGAKVTYDGDANNLTQAAWQMWYIDLASTGVNVSNVTELSIGFERIGAVSGQGMVFLDGIRLYSHDRQLITPTEPDAANLVGHWTFDDSSGATAADSSGKGYHGAITGAEWVAGQLGGALSFNGEDYVTVPPEAFSSIETQVTIAFWAYGDPDIQPQADCCFSAMQDVANDQSRAVQCHLPWSNGTVFWDTGGAGYDRISKAATPAEYEGSWQHWTFIKNADTGEQSIYLNGDLWHTGTGFSLPMTGVTAFSIGSRADGIQNYDGMMDDFRLYDRALTPEEIAWLAGVTMPFDDPF